MKKKKMVVKKKTKPVRKSLKKSPVKAAKKKKVLAIPKGYHSVIPYMVVDHAANAITFYKKAFGAKEQGRMDHPNGKVAHAELKIGDSRIMLADECHEMNVHSPKTHGGCAVSIHLYVKNVDAVVKAAVKAGAKLTSPVMDMFYGDRCGMLEDPFGHVWCVSTHIEDVTPAKVRKRAAEFYKQKTQ